MATQPKKKRGAERRAERAVRRKQGPGADRLPFQKANWLLFGAALLVILSGFATLAQGSITLAPILLVLGYGVLIPVAIMFKPRRQDVAEPGGSPGE